MPVYDPYTGTKIYRESDVVTDVFLNGQSVIDMQLVEAKVYPDGWGYILCLRTFENRDKPPKKLIDGQYLTHTYYGRVEVIE